ncbi:MAG: tRNA (adenosine(37)-N6)-dimethylallyltransferase MiaA [Actinomycetota bacterium]
MNDPIEARDSDRADSPEEAQQPVLAIVGPTASGKSAIAMEVAEQLSHRIEICCIDSMTLYRGMDIGTAKPTAADRARVPHHLLDIVDPAAPFSVSHFQRAARAAISSIHARGTIPLLVGGSGLYFRAVVDDLEFPPTDERVRQNIAEEDPATLREKLESFDPDAAATIDPRNLRRIVRAIEVIELTGSRFSDFREAWDCYESRYALNVVGMTARDLDARIWTRTRGMIERGLVDEVRGLLEQGFRESLTASRAISYGEIVSYLDGNATLEEAANRIHSATRQYARRQMIWFRRDPRVMWFEDPSSREITNHFAVALG